jgi:hypothetical protein
MADPASEPASSPATALGPPGMHVFVIQRVDKKVPLEHATGNCSIYQNSLLETEEDRKEVGKHCGSENDEEWKTDPFKDVLLPPIVRKEDDIAVYRFGIYRRAIEDKECEEHAVRYLGNSLYRLMCGHIFHANCIRLWFCSATEKRNTCPEC